MKGLSVIVGLTIGRAAAVAAVSTNRESCVSFPWFAGPLRQLWLLTCGLTAQCAALSSSADLGSRVSFPSDQPYNASISSYWSVLAQLPPSCVFEPTSADEVSTAVKILVPANCKFAIRGGGHTPWRGASGIEDGVTFDLGQMASTTFDNNTQTVLVGPGSRWEDVYSALDPLNVAIPGGRAGTVGVAGLTLGGEVSHHAHMFETLLTN